MRPATWIKTACHSCGIMLLILGAMSADPAFAGDYDDTYEACKSFCVLDLYGYGTTPAKIDLCIKEQCSRYFNVKCSDGCAKFPGGGFDPVTLEPTPCTNTGSNCGD